MQISVNQSRRSAKKVMFEAFLNTKAATIILPSIATVVLLLIWELAVFVFQIKSFNLTAQHWLFK